MLSSLQHPCSETCEDNPEYQTLNNVFPLNTLPPTNIANPKEVQKQPGGPSYLQLKTPWINSDARPDCMAPPPSIPARRANVWCDPKPIVECWD